LGPTSVIWDQISEIWPQKANLATLAGPGQFSRGKEKMKQWNYYETIASFTLFDKRLGKARHVNPDLQLSETHCLFESILKSVSASVCIKKGRIYGKGAPFKGAPQRFGGVVAPNRPPLDPPLKQPTLILAKHFLLL